MGELMGELVDFTGVDLSELVKEVYRVSIPVGMGFMHYEEGPLSDEQANHQVQKWSDDKNIALSMDYVLGRCCKFTLFRKGDKLLASRNWPDHTRQQMEALMNKFGIFE